MLAAFFQKQQFEKVCLIFKVYQRNEYAFDLINVIYVN